MSSKILIVVVALTLLFAGCVEKKTRYEGRESTTQTTETTIPESGNDDLKEMMGPEPTNPDTGAPDDVSVPDEDLPRDETDPAETTTSTKKGSETTKTTTTKQEDLSEMTGNDPLNPDYGEDDVTETTGDFV